nr:hypothetical protein [Staphylococcus aureus]
MIRCSPDTKKAKRNKRI